MEEYWKTELAGLQSQPFPTLPSLTYQPNPTATLARLCADFSKTTTRDQFVTTVHLAWAITLCHYTGTDDIVFGTATATATFPTRVQVNRTQQVDDVLSSLHSRSAQRAPFENIGLEKLSHLGPQAHAACQFQNMVVLGPRNPEITAAPAGESRALVLKCDLDSSTKVASMIVEAQYDDRTLSKTQVGWIVDYFIFILEQLIQQKTAKLIDIMTISPCHKNQIFDWNRHLPNGVQRCIHDLIAEQGRARPEAMAICAWDGNLTYQQLHRLSSRLAVLLSTQYRIKPGTFVPLCFEKSKWTTVAMLAVLKAGGAFLLLDPSQPTTRRQELSQQVQATVLLISVTQSASMTAMGVKTIIVGENTLGTWDGSDESSGSDSSHDRDNSDDSCDSDHSYGSNKRMLSRSPVQKDHPAYIVFTSGSTGKPKGIVIEHSSIATSTVHAGRKMGFGPDTRSLQLTSYTFDVSIAETLYALVNGGCVCVPDEAECRNGLDQAIRRYDINIANFTPSMARSLNPLEMTGLKTLILGGEGMQAVDVEMCTKHVTLINAYGPAECSIDAVINNNVAPGSDASNIGRPVAGACWIVDPEDPEKLTPVGAIGELILEGPTIGRGYLNESQKTSAVFINAPSWLQKFRNGRAGRLYRTGDLVQYSGSGDSSLRYVGRNDEQIKLRGQRIELGEVEFHLRSCFEEAEAVVAAVIQPVSTGAQQLLTAFVCSPSYQKLPVADCVKGQLDLLCEASEEFCSQVEEARMTLAQKVPKYMVPDLFLPLHSLPLNLSGKTDRRLLKDNMGSLSLGQMRLYHGTGVNQRREPSTPMERTLQLIVQEVIPSLAISDIGMGDEFFHLGGDSILAMKLVNHARRVGVTVSVADVFLHPRLEDLAGAMREASCGIFDDGEAIPFSLLDDHHRERVIQQAMTDCCVGQDQIEDIYPCTELQSWLIAMSTRGLDNYTITGSFDLPVDLDAVRFTEAWKHIIQVHPILRTCIIQDTSGSWLQVVLKELPTEQLNYSIKAGGDVWGYGQPLFQANLDIKKSKFVCLMHHVLYDGYSLPLLFRDVETAYNGSQLAIQSFQPFMQYISSIETTAKATWREIFKGFQGLISPPLPHQGYVPQQTAFREHFIPITTNDKKMDGITIPTKIRLALAILLSRHYGSRDVVFGTVVNSRAIPVANIENIQGPTASVMPLRVQLSRNARIIDALTMLKDRSVALEPSGMTCISHASPEAALGSAFQTMLIIHPKEDEKTGLFSKGHFNGQNMVADVAMAFICELHVDGIHIQCQFDPQIVSQPQVEKMLKEFSTIVGVINSHWEHDLDRLV